MLFSATSNKEHSVWRKIYVWHFVVDRQLKFLTGMHPGPTVCSNFGATWVFSSKTSPQSRSQDTRCCSTWVILGRERLVIGLGVTSYNSRKTSIKPCLLASKSGIPFSLWHVGGSLSLRIWQVAFNKNVGYQNLVVILAPSKHNMLLGFLPRTSTKKNHLHEPHKTNILR